MASILPSFEYDIFISYRQKDNKGEQWVTNFVAALKTELEATFKEDITIYFDQNPHDGLLANHDVDDSLKGKLRCLIFMPIISQTYCDTKSFAWKHEFLAFKEAASDDDLGLKIKLPNGNVASRILPISIHDLDVTDRQLVEAELGGPIRGIDFIYKTPGVVRPLKADEPEAKANVNHTYYHDQVNKVARACKDLINGIQHARSDTPKIEKHREIFDNTRSKRKWVISALVLLAVLAAGAFFLYRKASTPSGPGSISIAVLPFENMNKDPEQDYFASGIAEDILNHLTRVSDLKVKSRTSTLQYKGTQKSITEIGQELNVGNVLEGSVRRAGDKVRIVVQLIDVKTDLHLWSETYDRELKDVLSVQSEIAIEIANALNARLTSSEKEKIKKEPTKDATAYDYYLQAREQLNSGVTNKEKVVEAMRLINMAIERDPAFAKAYSTKAVVWAVLGGFGIPERTWQDSVFLNTSKSIALDPEGSYAYLVRSYAYRFLGKVQEARKDVLTANKFNPADVEVQTEYGYQLLRDGDERGADIVLRSIERNYSTKQNQYYESLAGPLRLIGDYDAAITMLQSADKLNPAAGASYAMASIYLGEREYDKALKLAEEELRVNPGFRGAYDDLAWVYFGKGDYKKAAFYWGKYTEIEAQFEDKTQTVPFRHRLAMALQKLGEDEKAKALLLEDLNNHERMLNKLHGSGMWGGRGYLFYDLAVDNALLGNDVQAIAMLDSTFVYDFDLGNRFYKADPAFEKIKDSPAYMQVQKKFDARSAFRKQAFTNAFDRLKASKEMKDVLK